MVQDLLKGILQGMLVHPATPALVSGGRVICFSDLGAMAQGILDGIGHVAKDEIILISGHKEPICVAAMLACMFSGRPFVFVDRSNPPQRAARIAQIAGAGTVLVAGKAADWPDMRVLSIDGFPTRPIDKSALEIIDPDALLYVIFTSGSTGEPKGVPISRANFAAFNGWYGEMLQSLPCDAAVANRAHVNHASLAFDMGMLDLWPVLALLRPVVMLDHRNNVVPRNNLSALCATEQVSVGSWFSTPSLLQIMCTEPSFNHETLPGLCTFFVGGEVVPRILIREIMRRFPSAEIRHAYGPSEVTCMTHVKVLTRDDLSEDGPLPLGFILGPNRMRIVDENGMEVPVGETGEVELSGPQVVRGYLPEDHPANRAFGACGGERTYRTGDIGWINTQGELFLMGRSDRQVKWNGNRIELDEIERTVHGLVGVQKAACLPIKDGARVIGIVLFVQRCGGAALGYASLSQAMAQALPTIMIPRDIRFVDQLPVTVNGKLDAGGLMNEHLASSAVVRTKIPC